MRVRSVLRWSIWAIVALGLFAAFFFAQIYGAFGDESGGKTLEELHDELATNPEIYERLRTAFISRTKEVMTHLTEKNQCGLFGSFYPAALIVHYSIPGSASSGERLRQARLSFGNNGTTGGSAEQQVIKWPL